MRKIGTALGSIFFILALAGEAAAGGAMQSTSPQTAPPAPQPKVTVPAKPPAHAPVKRPATPNATPLTIMIHAQYTQQTKALSAKFERQRTQLRNDYQRRRQMLWEQLRQVTNLETDARNFKHYAQADAYQQQIIKLRSNLDSLEANYVNSGKQIYIDYQYELENLREQYRQYF